MSRADCGAPRLTVDDDDVAEVEPAVRDTGVMKPGDLAQELLQELITHLIGGRELERVNLRLARDQQCVPFWSETDGDDLRDPDAGLRRHQCRQRLMLDLLEPPEGRASRRVAIGEEPPAASRALGVLSVAPQHAHLQRSSVPLAPEELRSADPLSLGGAKIINLDAE
jgi:hypothetical protein